MDILEKLERHLNEAAKFEFSDDVFFEMKSKVKTLESAFKEFKTSVTLKDNLGLITDTKSLKKTIDEIEKVIQKNSKGNY